MKMIFLKHKNSCNRVENPVTVFIFFKIFFKNCININDVLTKCCINGVYLKYHLYEVEIR